MSFLFGLAQRAPGERQLTTISENYTEVEAVYKDLIAQRPVLLDEKLKLHARIIDEFNLTLLEKMPREELVKNVRSYVADYVNAEKITLNQKELAVFTDEIINEMTGFGP